LYEILREAYPVALLWPISRAPGTSRCSH
jgi:hypothetical protein